MWCLPGERCRRKIETDPLYAARPNAWVPLLNARLLLLRREVRETSANEVPCSGGEERLGAERDVPLGTENTTRKPSGPVVWSVSGIRRFLKGRMHPSGTYDGSRPGNYEYAQSTRKPELDKRNARMWAFIPGRPGGVVAGIRSAGLGAGGWCS